MSTTELWTSRYPLHKVEHRLSLNVHGNMQEALEWVRFALEKSSYINMRCDIGKNSEGQWLTGQCVLYPGFANDGLEIVATASNFNGEFAVQYFDKSLQPQSN